MTTCENPATHQVTGTGQPVCKEHASRAKRDGTLVEVRPSPGPGAGRRGQPATCQHVDLEETPGDAEPNGDEGLDT